MSETVDVKVKMNYEFGKEKDLFDVNIEDTDVQYRNPVTGIVESGMVCRWANIGEGMQHREEFLSSEYYERCTDMRVKTPYANNLDKSTGSCGGEMPLIKRNGETYGLLWRPVEAANAQFEYEQKNGRDALRAKNTTAGAPAGVKPEYSLTSERRELKKNYVRKGR